MLFMTIHARRFILCIEIFLSIIRLCFIKLIYILWLIYAQWTIVFCDSYFYNEIMAHMTHLHKMKISVCRFVWWLMKLIYLVWLISFVRKFTIFDSYINNEKFVHMTHFLSVKYWISVIHITCMKIIPIMIRFFVMIIFVTWLIFYGWDIICIDSFFY